MRLQKEREQEKNNIQEISHNQPAYIIHVIHQAASEATKEQLLVI